MEDYLFHEGTIQSGYSQDFESSLFNDLRHLRLQSQNHWHSYYLLYEKYRIISAAIHFHVDKDYAQSPLKSPYGSVEFSDDVAPLTLFRFIEYVESRLKEIGVKKICIKDCPAGYRSTQAAVLHTFLFNLGYTTVDAEVGALLPISNMRFEAALDDWEKRKLRQAAEMHLAFKEIPLEQLGEIYLFILGCRKQKGYSLSMSLSDLKETAGIFARNFMLFGIFQHEKLVAASISVRVKKKILYNFYSAHLAEFDSVSPVVFLTENMYRYCQDHQIDVLDLGTSAIDGKPNFGLLDFKLRLGANPTPKLTFEKIIV